LADCPGDDIVKE